MRSDTFCSMSSIRASSRSEYRPSSRVTTLVSGFLGGQPWITQIGTAMAVAMIPANRMQQQQHIKLVYRFRCGAQERAG